MSQSQGYGDDPDTLVVRHHFAIDLVTAGPQANRFGDPIRSAAAGEVVYAGFAHSTLGNVVIIQHHLADGSPVTTIYAHLKDITVTAGDVTVGQVIGTMGTAIGKDGKAYPAHLHFAMRLGEYPIGTDVTDWTGFGYSDEADPDPYTSGFIDPEWFLNGHRDPTENSLIFGTQGDDDDIQAPGRTAIFGTASNDEIYAQSGNDLVYGRGGNDVLDSGFGQDTLSGGEGDDIVISYGVGKDSLDGDAGLDGLWLDRSDLSSGQVIDLSSGQMVVLTDGTSIRNFEWFVIQTGDGNDTITIDGSTFEQRVDAHAGRDRVILDYSQTVERVNFQRVTNVALSDTTISIGPGREQSIYLTGFEDFTINGGSGNDRLDAQFMISSVLSGNGGDDRLFGTNSVDELYGGGGNDVLHGFNCHEKADRLFGGSGNDTLTSTGDGAILNGGSGNDVLTGGTGGVRSDRFVFKAFFGKDRITDFEAGPDQGDTLDLSALHLTLSDLQIRSANSGLSTRITVTSTGDSILLSGVSLSSLDLASDLIL